jgi:hypothetical protein
VTDLVVVPTPLRQQRASRRLCDAGGGILLGPRVLTPRALAPAVLAGAGDARLLLSPLAERLLALDAARLAGLLDSGSPARGAARAAADLVAELRQGEVTSAVASRVAASLGGRPGERLAAGAAALAAYEDRLDALGALDAAGALRAAATALRRGAAPPELGGVRLLVLEGLLPSTPGHLDLVGALLERARRVVARIPWFPDRPDRGGPAEPWLRRIEALEEGGSRRDVSVVLPAVRGPGEPGAASRRVVALPAPGDEEQAEGAARLAGRLVDEGFLPADVAVVAPRRLAAPLARAFAEARVPFAAGAPVPIAALPVIRDLAAAVAAAGGLARAHCEALLSSPYLGGGAPPGLARHLDAAGAVDGRGDPEEALRARAARLVDPHPRVRSERRALLRAAGAIGELRCSLAPLRAPATPREWAGRLRALVDRLGIRRRAARGEPEVVRRDLAALARWEEAVGDLAAALAMAGRAHERVERAEMADLLDAAVRASALPLAGEPAGGAVELWPPEEAPGLSARAVLVLGAERGAWPAPPGADPLLGDAARAAVNAELRRRALPTAAWRRAAEEHAGHAALAAASEVLAVGWNRVADGDPPAPLAAEGLAWGSAAASGVAVDPPLPAARAPAEALRAAGRLAREGGPAVAVEPLRDAGLAARAASVGDRGEAERVRREAWLARRPSRWAGAIPPALAGAWRARLPGEWSATQLETFGRCPYRLFLRLAGLADEPAAAVDIAPRDEGSLLHAVLEAFLRARLARGAWPPCGSAEERDEAAEVAREVFEAYEAKGRTGDPATWRARREAVLQRIRRWVDAEARDGAGLAPVLLEFRFGGDSGRPPIAFRDGEEEVRLEGRVDRVDAGADRLLVLDYKNARDRGGHEALLDPEALGVTSFQAPLYAMVAARELPGRSRLAATYALLPTGERVEPWEVDAGDGFLALDEARRAEVRAAGGRTFADAVAAVVRAVRRGELPVAPRDCEGCPYGAVCRFPGARGPA